MRKCVILDIDGVIVYSKNAVFHLYSEILKEQGQEFRKEDIAKIYGKTDKETHLALKELGYALPEYALYRKLADKHKEAATKFYELTPIGNVLHLLKETNTLCVATNRTDESAKRILEQFRIYGLFECVATVSKFKPKPEPDMLLHCIQSTGADKSEALFVGDTAVDKKAGEQAGIKTMIVAFE